LYHGKPREIAKFPDVALTVLVPPFWQERWSRGRLPLEVEQSEFYDIQIGKVFFPGQMHFAFFKEKIANLMKRLQPDIIDIEDEPFNTGSAQVIYLRNRLSPKARIVMHTSQTDCKRYPPPFNIFERYSHRNVSAFMARSQDAADILRRKGYKGKVEILTHGIDPTKFVWNRNSARSEFGWTNDSIIGYIGVLEEHKGLDVLLRAAANLNCRIVLIGDGSSRDTLKRLSNDLHLNERLMFVPPVPHREVPKYLAAMDLFILPSRTKSNWREKFGRVLIEAMAAGVPLIGSDSGEIPNVIGDAGLIFSEDNVEELESKIKYLFDHPEDRSILAEKGRERVRKFYSWEAIASRTHDLYKSVLSQQ